MLRFVKEHIILNSVAMLFCKYLVISYFCIIFVSDNKELKEKKIMNIALVAHDARKKELIEWVLYNMGELKKHKLYATGTTGSLIRQAYIDTLEDFSVENDIQDDDEEWEKYKKETSEELVTCLLSGPLGGDQQIGAMIAEGKIDILIFFCDNLITQGHQQDVGALSRLASLYNIPFATNRTTADMILTSSLFNNDGYQRIVPRTIETYAKRKVN